MSRTRPVREVSSLRLLEEALRRIRTDRVHGASSLSMEALDELARRVGELSSLPKTKLTGWLRRAARILETTQPAMGPFLRWARELRELASRPRGNPFPSVRSWLRREQKGLRSEAPGLLRSCRGRFPRAREVVTISRSSSVLLVLSALPRTRRPRRVSVLESLPGGEGRLFARELRQAGLTARVIPDRARGEAARAADLVIFGADAVFSDLSVAHKVGTRALATAAMGQGVKVVVVAGHSKFTLGPAPRRPLPPWFDRTPARFISEYWTDRGIRLGGR